MNELNKKFNELLEKAAELEKCHPQYILNYNSKRNSLIRKTINWHLIKVVGFKFTDFDKTSIYQDMKLIDDSKDAFVSELKEFLNN